MKYTVEAIVEVQDAIDVVLLRVEITKDIGIDPTLQEAVDTLQGYRNHLGKLTVSL